MYTNVFISKNPKSSSEIEFTAAGSGRLLKCERTHGQNFTGNILERGYFRSLGRGVETSKNAFPFFLLVVRL